MSTSVHSGALKRVRFVSYEDDGTDQIVSFALAHGDTDIRSLILQRTPKYEPLLDDTDRGVCVSLEGETGDARDLLTAVRMERDRVTIETGVETYDLDVSAVEPTDLSRMKALIRRMNFDDSFACDGV